MNPARPERVHITGGAGSGKTTLARQLGALLEAPILELDGRGLEFAARLAQPIDFDALRALRAADAQRFVSENNCWVSEGSCIAPYRVLFEKADIIVWLDVRWPLASYRILSRHVKATIARNNRFPGWLRLYRFWCFSRRFYGNRNPPGFNEWGTPSTHATLTQELGAYETKLVTCRDHSDVRSLLQHLSKA